jgi:secondary thiamine-phosphate synthase enzyme
MIADASLAPMESRELSLRTTGPTAIVDLTRACAEFVSDVAGGGDGLLSVFVPHATAGLALIELGAGSEDDLRATLDRIVPRGEGWRHRHGSPGHGADHVLPAFVAPSVTIPVIAGRMALGTWQSLALVDPNRDNPERRVRLSFLRGP